jgi:hypothetical protein
MAVDVFLDSLGDPHTVRKYGVGVGKTAERLGENRPLASVADEMLGEAREVLWGSTAVNTWNTHRAAVLSWPGWCRDHGHEGPAVSAWPKRPAVPDAETPVRSKMAVGRLIAGREVHVREKELRRMLYETTARAEEILGVGIEELDLAGPAAYVVMVTLLRLRSTGSGVHSPQPCSASSLIAATTSLRSMLHRRPSSIWPATPNSSSAARIRYWYPRASTSPKPSDANRWACAATWLSSQLGFAVRCAGVSSTTDVDGDQAAASANSLVYFYRVGRPPHLTSGLRLACTAVRTPAGWRLRSGRRVAERADATPSTHNELLEWLCGPVV